jgi:hypothetical protein
MILFAMGLENSDNPVNLVIADRKTSIEDGLLSVAR